MNQKREVETRTAQFEVCVATVGAKMGRRVKGRRGMSFMVVWLEGGCNKMDEIDTWVELGYVDGKGFVFSEAWRKMTVFTITLLFYKQAPQRQQPSRVMPYPNPGSTLRLN